MAACDNISVSMRFYTFTKSTIVYILCLIRRIIIDTLYLMHDSRCTDPSPDGTGGPGTGGQASATPSAGRKREGTHVSLLGLKRVWHGSCYAHDSFHAHTHVQSTRP